LSDVLMLVLVREYYDGNLCINALYYTCGGMM